MSIINASAGNIDQACLFIFYSALFDMSDGIVARFTQTSSRFGVELDSLSDLVSFGAAPSFILYKAYFYHLEGIGIAISSLVMIFGALRLARFNIQLTGFDKNYFSGVPVPISAITIASFFLFYFNKIFSVQTSEVFTLILSILLPVLMLSRFKYDTTPGFSKSELKKHPVKFIFILLIVILVAATNGEGLFAFTLFYLSTGIIRSVKNFIKKHFLKRKGEITEDMKLNTGN
jgi:CDP-diacylglycerol--serine O-phosphatidyltransferase